MTATLFNYSYHHTSSREAQRPVAPQAAVKSVVIVGGGTAGWMTAMILANALIKKGVEISVLESPTVDIIGVGEGSTPWLRGFFDSLDIEESEWMPECNATYKCGIAFDSWSTKPGFERYFHPFASMLDNLTMTQFVHNARARVQRRRRSRPSQPFLHRVASRRRAHGADPGQQFSLRCLVRLPLRFRAPGQVPAQEGGRARRQVQELSRHSREPGRSRRHRLCVDPGGRNRSPPISSSTARVSRRF